MPYLDLPKSHPHFKAVQRIGATGILRGEGRNVGWENQTWFRTADPLLAEEIHAEGYYGGHTGFGNGPVSVGNLIQAISALGGNVMPSAADWWSSLGLTDFNADRTATRLEAAVVIDAAFNPFNMHEVDYDGEFLR